VALDGVIQPLLRQTAQREARDAAPGEDSEQADALARAQQAWAERWKGLRGLVRQQRP